jgi:hypothetical protein
MIDGFRYALPEDFTTELVGSDHDLGAVILGWDQRERAQAWLSGSAVVMLPLDHHPV